MAKTGSLQARRAELEHFAKRKGWSRGAMGSWRAGRLTIAVANTGYPRADFVATDRLTKESRKFKASRTWSGSWTLSG